MATTVLLIEDHLAFAQALRAVFDLEEDLEVVGVVTRADDAHHAAAGATPDVAVVDLDLPGGGGVEAIRAVRTTSPGTRFLVLTALRDRLELARVVEVGVSGLLHKSADVLRVLDAVRRIAAGQHLLPPELLASLLGDLATSRSQNWRAALTREQLSPREVEVLAGLAQGLPMATIAASLGIASETAETHLRNARAKLGVSSRLEAVIEAIRLELVEPPSALPGDLPGFG